MTKQPRFSCCKCGSNRYKVLESRPHADWIRRRIACQHCESRVTTYEISERQFMLYEIALRAHQKEQPCIADRLRSIADELEGKND